MPESRREERHRFIHPIDINIDGKCWDGEVIDWSLHGVQICAPLYLESTKLYEITFHVERLRAIAEPSVDPSVGPSNATSKSPTGGISKSILAAEVEFDIWLRKATLRWQKPSPVGSWFGLEFDKELDEHPGPNIDFPIDHLGEHLTARDACHLGIKTLNK